MATATETDVETECINAIRFLAVDAVNKANSGHPGAPMGQAPIGYLLYAEEMQYNPEDPKWVNRDRFVLSSGHGCMLQYSLLHLAGYKSVAMDDIKQFRQWGSKTPGHREKFETDGIEVTTGPLGMGISNAVGLAAAEAHLAAVYNKPGMELIDHYTYTIAGDGCMQEGISHEACAYAGHLGLGKLIAFYDDNGITIDGHTDLSFTEDATRNQLGWNYGEFEEYQEKEPELAAQFKRAVIDRKLPENWCDALPKVQILLQMKCTGDFLKDSYAERNMRLGIRELGMGAVGEDGPTHQPIETIPSLRLIPDLTVMRPADGNETAGAYKYLGQRDENMQRSDLG
eukprot:Skav225184  [mRNA]  locus=scaffold716:11000:15514:- [translate_table: standard]